MNSADISELVNLVVQLQIEHLRAVKEGRLPENIFMVDRIVELVGSERTAIDVIATADARALRDFLAQLGLDAEDALQTMAISGFNSES